MNCRLLLVVFFGCIAMSAAKKESLGLWKIKAKGMGLQNLNQQSYGGGGYGGGYGGSFGGGYGATYGGGIGAGLGHNFASYSQPQVVYYPVPIYAPSPSYASPMYQKAAQPSISVIPIALDAGYGASAYGQNSASGGGGGGY